MKLENIEVVRHFDEKTGDLAGVSFLAPPATWVELETYCTEKKLEPASVLQRIAAEVWESWNQDNPPAPPDPAK